MGSCNMKSYLLSAAACCLAACLPAESQLFYQWYSLGPQPVNTLNSSNQVIAQDSGRVTTLAVDPSSPSHWLLGAAQGGIWETLDRGASWSPRTDDQASLAMGAIAFAPSNPSRVYAGTGEANFRGDAYAGAGLLLSQDGGTHWQMLNTNFAKTAFSRVRVNSANASNLVVATARGGGGVGQESSGTGNVPGAPARGVFTSTDGGVSFGQVLEGEATALEINPNNFCEQYAGLGEPYGAPTNGVYRTTNCWLSFELIQGPWPAVITNVTYLYTNYVIGTNTQIDCTNTGSGTGPCITNTYPVYTNVITGSNVTYSLTEGRIVMASSPSAPDVLYVGIAHTRSRYVAGLYGLWITTNAWAPTPTWTALPPPPVSGDGVSMPRFWYMLDLLVDRADPFTLYLAEFNVWRYRSGSWTGLAGWGFNEVHPDNHVMVWVPGGGQGDQMLLGNDGGAYLSAPGVAEPWTSLNSQLRITQFYKGAVDPTGQNVLALGGAQDMFTSLYTGGPVWPAVLGGDGGDCAISAANPLKEWALSLDTGTDNPMGGNQCPMVRTLFGFFPSGYTAGANDIDDVLPFSQQFYVHFEKAPFNDDLMLAGTATLWRCANFFSGIPSWSRNSPTMTDAAGTPVPISTMAFAPSANNGLVYAFGTEDGQLRVTANGGANWNDPDPADAVPGRYVSGLAFSPSDPNTLYVTLSGFDEGTPGHSGHLFKSTNVFSASPTWQDVSPPIDEPNNCLAIDPKFAGSVYVGTDHGVWYSFNAGTSWSHYGTSSGMPNVAVYDLRFDQNSRLMAFTHGRGAYLLTPINIPILVLVPLNPHLTPNCLTCPPEEPWLNPGDEVTVEIPLQNILPIDTVDLQATLLPNSQVTPLAGTQSYGVVKGQGPAITRSFRFIAAGTVGGAGGGPGPAGDACGGILQLVLQLSDQGKDLGQVSMPFQLGQPSHPLVEDFEIMLPPALPPGWLTDSSGAGALWSATAVPPPNMPELGEDAAPLDEIPNTSVMVPDSLGVGQSYLISPAFTVATAQAQLFFRQSLKLAPKLDGGVLEIAIGTLPFQDIVQAGGVVVKDGYNATLNDRNPLGPRAAWSGDSGGWLPVVVNLPASAAGQSVRLRWHLATTVGQTNGAWFVDSVRVTEPNCRPPVVNPTILNPAVQGRAFTFSINTISSRNYVIEYKTNLTDTAWQTWQTVAGDGTQQTLSVPLTTARQQFFRLVVQ